jgi:hypothetical protein
VIALLQDLATGDPSPTEHVDIKLEALMPRVSQHDTRIIIVVVVVVVIIIIVVVIVIIIIVIVIIVIIIMT